MIDGRTRCVLACLCAAAVVSGAAAEDTKKKGIDWEAGVVRATGSGAPDLNAPNIAVARLGAERAAKLDAMRNILETLKGVQVTAGSTVGGIMESDSRVKAEIQGIVRNFKIVDTRYYSDGGVEVDVEMKLDGKLTRLLMPPVEKKKVPTGGAKKWTSLIIDARGQEASPVVVPSVVDEKGEEIYGPSVVSDEAVERHGMVAYVGSLEAAKKSERAGEKPLVVKALRAENGRFVITNADASPLKSPENDLSFLAEGRVLVVLN
ncbi:MAG: hypothetical protein D6729_08570 [Deltaproteobacteria bacterium]|nr:MAG: hypothetical protein D6729_08570 [Deltaproteobacteria bacterium]